MLELGSDTLCCLQHHASTRGQCTRLQPSRRPRRGTHLKSFGQHFSLGQSALWLSACASSWTLFVLTISRRQFWHCGALAISPDSGSWRGNAYNRRGLRGLDGQAVRLDGRAGASLVGGLVFALDLVGVSGSLWRLQEPTYSVFLGDRHGFGVQKCVG
jgi:hypothetical protein